MTTTVSSNTKMYTEQTPLLQAAATKAKAYTDSQQRNNDIDNKKPGPLELSRSTRYGILLGLWIANFLSVSLRSLL
jgi:hypothetical protein